ncbi:predicted protein [Sclerotinia sclerotiorum 1980 UF-70]|uniref:Uncharacterized protein n=1 Tax=Sclerotinia sclerotiorum (strain ATCC 18683 / 1980 / Ss-1) TaxID=665079 RepID=A7EM99_SCLS1|nr:predicted protein [Sclerotinia sclerotiorum 1980 UF-70]EDO03965.1 predicted protein [Sclerotinia sclerotiorum 1980 UF-70]
MSRNVGSSCYWAPSANICVIFQGYPNIASHQQRTILNASPIEKILDPSHLSSISLPSFCTT